MPEAPIIFIPNPKRTPLSRRPQIPHFPFPRDPIDHSSSTSGTNTKQGCVQAISSGLTLVPFYNALLSYMHVQLNHKSTIQKEKKKIQLHMLLIL